jgi:thiamine biosynthesis lipoprotein
MNAKTSPSLLRRRFPAMGTLVSVTLALEQAQPQDRAEAALLKVQRELERFGREAWAWGSGALARFNGQLAAGSAAPIPPELHALFLRAWEIHRASEGLYEPRIASLVELWGFHDLGHPRDAPPPKEQIETRLAALRAAPAYDGGTHYGPAPGVGWDLGGIAKGWIVDLLLARLGELGFTDACVDAGGNLAVRGRAGARPWRIGIRDPRAGQGAPSLLAALDVCDAAVNTHADDQRYFEHGGRRYAHLLDPRHGKPAQSLRSLTVVHPDGTLAEAGGAALYVAGRAHWPRLAQRLGLAQVLAVDALGNLQATAALAPRLMLREGLRLEVVD